MNQEQTYTMSTKASIKTLVIKALSLFSTVRLYNISIIAIAQLLAAVFIIAPELSVKEIVLDYKLWLIILASAAAIAGGYIINNFYDREKDLINRPQKTMLENQVSRSTLWTVYFTVNAVAFILGLIVSWRAGLFFALIFLPCGSTHIKLNESFLLVILLQPYWLLLHFLCYSCITVIYI